MLNFCIFSEVYCFKWILLSAEFSFSDSPEMGQIQRSLGGLLKELEQIRATLTVHLEVTVVLSDCSVYRVARQQNVLY